MTTGIAVKSLDFAGGAQVAEKQSFFIIQAQPVAVLGSHVLPHPPTPPHTTGPAMVQGSGMFFINGIPACRAGNVAACGHATTGRSWFLID